MSTDGSVTHWLDQLRAGDHAAAQHLWERYFGRLVHLAHAKLRGKPGRVSPTRRMSPSALSTPSAAASNRAGSRSCSTATACGDC